MQSSGITKEIRQEQQNVFPNETADVGGALTGSGKLQLCNNWLVTAENERR
jgi:hypothetical protein